MTQTADQARAAKAQAEQVWAAKQRNVAEQVWKEHHDKEMWTRTGIGVGTGAITAGFASGTLGPALVATAVGAGNAIAFGAILVGCMALPAVVGIGAIALTTKALRKST